MLMVCKLLSYGTLQHCEHIYNSTLNSVFYRTTWHQKDKPFWILMKQEMMGWHWHHLNLCKLFALCSSEINLPSPYHSIFTGWVLFLTLDQQSNNIEVRFTVN